MGIVLAFRVITNKRTCECQAGDLIDSHYVHIVIYKHIETIYLGIIFE